MKRYVPLLAALLLLSAAGVAQARQAPFPGDVAILVVDVFEEPAQEASVSQEELAGKECALSLDGQDGMAVQGNVTSALHPLSLPHGRLVYLSFQQILANQYSGVAYPAASLPIQSQWSGDVERWHTPNGNIWLVGIDTHQYAIDAITTQTADAIDTLMGFGIERFVVNMSFGIAPCSEIPPLTPQDYIDKLQEWGVTCINPDEAGLQALACNLYDNDFTGNLVPNLVALRDAGGQTAAAFALLHMAVVRPRVEQVLLQAVSPANQLPQSEQAAGEFTGAAIDVNAGGSAEIIQVASAGNAGLKVPYYPAIQTNVLSVSADYSSTACPPGSPQDVADFLTNDLGLSASAVSNVIDYIILPMTNAGEVMADGYSHIPPAVYLDGAGPDADVLGCLPGTSFAAPQVSAMMAQRLLLGKGSICQDNAGGTLSAPPLAHDIWDDLDIPTAASAWCNSNFP